MKITFLGTAAATACPLVFCNCPMCAAGWKQKGKDFRRRASALIGEDLIIDLGPDVMTAAFDFGTDGDDETELRKEGYVINDNCIGCGSCVAVCPQNCISTDSIPFDIHASHCLHCGNCMNACPAGAVERR